MTFCFHLHTSFPQTRIIRGIPRFTYVSCLECGSEFHYDPVTFKRGDRLRPDTGHPVPLETKEAQA